jgi:NAD-dependent SIR2 family protein deacetylase
MDGRRTAVDGLDAAAGLLGAARRIVVFSGAGISTDSGIIV